MQAAMKKRADADELLSIEGIASYLDTRPLLADRLSREREFEAREVGDGNLNLVFIVRDSAGASLVLKQALPYVRVAGPTWRLTPERAGCEARALRVHGLLAAEYVPAVYDFDEDRHIIAMEDLSEFTVWRGALDGGERHERAAADMGTYVARIAFGTSVFAVAPTEVKARAAEAVNPRMCEITEDLVFSEPYIDAERDWFQGEVTQDVDALRADGCFLAAMAELKYTFMTHAEALIHGDLHTGSVMVRHGATARAFDSEFAFYGPVGFDLSCLLGNYVLAYVRAVVLGQEEHAEWLRTLPRQTWDAFCAEMERLWPSRRDQTGCPDRYLGRWLKNVCSDTVGMAGAELCRRTIGYAHVADIESLPLAGRATAVRAVLSVARRIVVERAGLSDLESVMTATDEALRATTSANVRAPRAWRSR